MTTPDRADEPPNPYQAPRTVPEAEDQPTPVLFAPEWDDPRKLRTNYLGHEARVRTIGILNYLRAGFSLVNAAIAAWSTRYIERAIAQAQAASVSPGLLQTIMIGVGLFGALFYFLLGDNLRRLRNWARIVSLIFAVLSILGGIQVVLLFVQAQMIQAVLLSISVAVNGYIAYVLLASDNRTVFSREYRAAVAATPDIHPRMSPVDYFLLAVLTLTWAVGILLPLF